MGSVGWPRGYVPQDMVSRTGLLFAQELRNRLCETVAEIEQSLVELRTQVAILRERVEYLTSRYRSRELASQRRTSESEEEEGAADGTEDE